MFNIRNIIPNMMSKLPKNEIKHRHIIDLGASYGTIFERLDGMTDADYEKRFKTIMRVFENMNRIKEYDEKK